MTQQVQRLTAKSLFEKDEVKAKFADMLGKRSTAFITSVLQIVSSNELLKDADPTSIYQAAAVAATLDLPLNNNLGFAYIVPFNSRQKDGTYKQMAQFQLGYKGFLQLALRSGQFLAINEAPIYEGQIKSNNPLTGIEFDFSAKKSDLVIGYAAYFKLLNGFEKTLFMTVDELKKHGKKYSQTYKKGFGLWNDDFDAMARKTVIKLLLSKGAPLSVEMQKAVITDQAVINDADTLDVDYTDNDKTEIDKEAERIRLMVGDCQTVEDLNHLQETIGADFPVNLFDERRAEINGSK